MGESLLNGRRYSTATRLRAGDEIGIRWHGRPENGPMPDLACLFEDGHLLAVDKPAGIASHPMGRFQAGTVVQFARLKYAERVRECLDRGDMGFYPNLVNRLDVHTSGIILVALTGVMHRAMQELVLRRLISREYVALVEGSVSSDRGSIEFPIGPDMTSRVRLKMACRADGKDSVTNFEVIERFPRHTLLRVTPRTGRQHQIRVHLAEIGHPVLGDLLYKDEGLFLAAQEPAAPLPSRHCLHARCTGFTHPVTGGVVGIEAPIPGDFELVVRELRAAGRAGLTG